ncbi:stabilizer of axonemal microtubules 2-like [Lineus longissimus]|uniref:stabilizer of axonemal microtubules 2-like n=1 Tax=Lineus longissimus TaxID=88925 RepID=UPI00315C7774
MKHKPKVVPPMDMTTTYGTDFSEKKGERLKPIKPKSDIRQNNSWTSKKACKTVHQLTFLKYDEESLKNCRPAAVRKKDNMVWPKKPFNAISTVQADFVEHLGAERRQPIKPDVRERVSGDFNDSTTYRHEYTPKENHGFAYVRPRDEYKPNPEKFSAVTTAMADFKAHKNVTRARSFKPPQSYVRSSTPFDGRTVKSIVHRAWPAVKPRTPACKQAKFVPPTVGFAKTSSYMVI